MSASIFQSLQEKKSDCEENNRPDAEKHRYDLLLRQLLLQKDGAQKERPQKTHLGDRIHDGRVPAGVHPRHEKDDAGDEHA